MADSGKDAGIGGSLAARARGKMPDAVEINPDGTTFVLGPSHGKTGLQKLGDLIGLGRKMGIENPMIGDVPAIV